MHPIVQRLHALDKALALQGFPRTSPWWLETLERFYATGNRQLVLRVGRRGGKSSTLCRVGVLEALYGEHHVPPGDLGVVAIVSTHRDEAAQRLRTVKAILDALSVKYRPIDGGIELADRPVAFKVYTASISGVSGFTAISVVCDEVSKWRDSDTGANPAREVLSSLRPTMATQPNARIFLSSSPLGRLDAHAAAFDRGDDDFQCVGFAPTWVANPSLTEAATHALERDEDRWSREFAALPIEEAESSLLSSTLLDRVTRAESLELPRAYGHSYVAAIDPATRGNAWTLCIATRRRIEGRSRRSIVLAREWRGSTAKPLEPDKVLAEIAIICREYGITSVVTDQWHGDSLAAIGRRVGISLSIQPMTAGRKVSLYEDFATWIADCEVDIPAHPQLRADLLNIRRKLTPNGFTISLALTPDGRHADYAPAAVAALERAWLEAREPPPAPGSAEAIREDDRRMVREQEAAYLKKSGVPACSTCRGAGCRSCAGLGRRLTRRRRPPSALEIVDAFHARSK